MAVFARPHVATLVARLREPRRHIQVVLGPRQVGKTTAVAQAAAALAPLPVHTVSADDVAPGDRVWLAQQWQTARALAGGEGALLVIDEVQKVSNWSESVKRLWDEDTARRRPLKVVLLGSSPLLVQQGLTESLAGRFEALPMGHWSWDEMQAAFGYSLDDYIYFGGYPGAAALRGDEARWRAYLRDSLIETTVARDLLLMRRIDKPALLRRLFALACELSGQIVAYQKMLGQLQDAGNTTTLAHYLDLLAGAGLVVGIPKYAGNALRKRASSPKLAVLNTALMSALASTTFDAVRSDPARWGRWVESAVGAHLLHGQLGTDLRVHYWREGDAEVDFVLALGERLLAVEVKSGRLEKTPGLDAFLRAYPHAMPLRVGEGGVPLERFLRSAPASWLR